MAGEQIKLVASLLLVLNFCMYVIVLRIGEWAMNHAIDHGFLIGDQDLEAPLIDHEERNTNTGNESEPETKNPKRWIDIWLSIYVFFVIFCDILARILGRYFEINGGKSTRVIAYIQLAVSFSVLIILGRNTLCKCMKQGRTNV